MKPIALLPALLGIGLLAASLSGISRPAVAQDHLRVGKPEAKGYDFAILDIGVQTGIFARHGIVTETLNFAGGAKAQGGLAADAIDLYLGGGPDMAGIAKGVPAKGVGAMAGAPMNMALIVRSDGEFTNGDQLRGHTVGISTPASLTAWLATDYPREKGWGTDGLRRVALGTMDSELAGLLSKNVDSLVGNTEAGYTLQAAGRVKVLVVFGETIHDYLTHVIYASNPLITQHPDTLRRFLAGWYETVRYMRDHRAETIAITRPITLLSQDIAERIYDEQRDMYMTDGHFPPAAMAVLRKSFVELGLLEQVPPDDVMITEAFLPK
jgi:ABC-type nitrate/sulfonate/bicarbonate transport system substrate-binding protein